MKVKFVVRCLISLTALALLVSHMWSQQSAAKHRVESVRVITAEKRGDTWVLVYLTADGEQWEISNAEALICGAAKR